MTTPFGDKVEILAEFYDEYKDSEEWSDFFEALDLGIPLAVLISIGGAEPTEKGIGWVNEAWDEMCESLEIDRHGNYSSLGEVMEYAASE